MTRRVSVVASCICTVLALAIFDQTQTATQAALTLSPAGTAQGLSLTTFASGFPNASGVGPLGIAYPGSGVMVTDYLGNVRVFPNHNDGQNAASVAAGQNYGLGNAADVAQAAGNFYVTRQSMADVMQINADGTFNQVIVTGISLATGLAANPTNGHLFVSTYNANAIYDVDPIAKSKTTFLNVSLDGMTVSPDGSILYGARLDGHIIGYRIADKSIAFDSGFIPNGIDGMALGIGPVFGGYFFANTNGGTVVEVNATTLAQTTIATGGSRGDFVRVDPTNSTLLLTQTDSILRLSGASFNLPGDYNQNGKVDAPDYVLWRKSPVTYNGNPNGYNIWRQNFGATVGGGSTFVTTALPEPAAFLLISLGAVVAYSAIGHRHALRPTRRSARARQ